MMTARSTLRAEKYEVTITMSSELELPIVYRLMGCPHANTFRFQSDEVVTKCSRNPSSIRRSLATLNMLSRAFELSRALELLSGAAKAHVITCLNPITNHTCMQTADTIVCQNSAAQARADAGAHARTRTRSSTHTAPLQLWAKKSRLLPSKEYRETVTCTCSHFNSPSDPRPRHTAQALADRTYTPSWAVGFSNNHKLLPLALRRRFR